MSRQVEQPESCCAHQQSKRARQHDPDAYQSTNSLFTEINGCIWCTAQHVAIRLRFSGQHDELHEQFDKSAGWLHAHGCSPSQPWKPKAGAIGASSCSVHTKDTIPGDWNMSGKKELLILPKKKSYLHICVYSAAKQSSASDQ